MGGRGPRPSPERADVHVLALPAEPMAAKRGLADRPRPAEPPAADRLKAAGVDRAVRGQPDASDHAPVWVELSDEGGKRGPSRANKSSSSWQGLGQVRSVPAR